MHMTMKNVQIVMNNTLVNCKETAVTLSILDECFKADPDALQPKYRNTGPIIGNQNPTITGKRTPLHWAFNDHSDIKVIQYLIEKGANINVQDELNDTPIMKTWTINKELLVWVLSKANFDIFVENNKGYTYYDIYEMSNKDNLECAKTYFANRGKGDCAKKHGFHSVSTKKLIRCNICTKRINQRYEGSGYREGKWVEKDIAVNEVVGCIECNYYECAN
eukprot:212611_1